MRSIGPGELTYIALATRWTLLLSGMALVGGGTFGAMLMLGGISRRAWPREVVIGFCHLVQGTPLLILLLLTYFGSSAIGLNLGALVSSVLALTVYAGAFLATIWVAAINAVRPGQWEGAAAVGLRRGQQLRLVVLPQAVRLALPPTCGFVVQLIKNTSLASIIGVIELTRAGQIVSNATLQPLPAFGAVAALYFALCLPVTLLTEWLEKREMLSAHG
jgi:polar amino acid transport system permease protein